MERGLSKITQQVSQWQSQDKNHTTASQEEFFLGLTLSILVIPHAPLPTVAIFSHPSQTHTFLPWLMLLQGRSLRSIQLQSPPPPGSPSWLSAEPIRTLHLHARTHTHPPHSCEN